LRKREDKPMAEKGNVVIVKILNLDGYVSGVQTSMFEKEAQVLEKAGKIKILAERKEVNKMAPEPAKKGGKK